GTANRHSTEHGLAGELKAIPAGMCWFLACGRRPAGWRKRRRNILRMRNFVRCRKPERPENQRQAGCVKRISEFVVSLGGPKKVTNSRVNCLTTQFESYTGTCFSIANSVPTG